MKENIVKKPNRINWLYASANLLILALPLTLSAANLPKEGGVFMMPMNCSELIPDNTPFINFFEAVARGSAADDKPFSKRLLRISSLREKMNNNPELSREENPIDILIRKTICFYREQKDPLRLIPFDDSTFTAFLKSSLRDLETKVDDLIFQAQVEHFQKKEYERKLLKNKTVIDQMEKEADKEADRSFERLSNAAKRKVQTN
jgi:hypothetical protein